MMSEVFFYPIDKTKNITLECLTSIIGSDTYNSFLDFGGNRGNLLNFPEFKIRKENYTCVDVSKPAVTYGATHSPESKFIHYNRYSSVYNPYGSKSYNFPDIDKNQELIFSFSVFTHTDFEELKNTVNWFKTFNYKKIALSLLDINNINHLEWFYNKRKEQFGFCEDIRKYHNSNTNILYFIHNNYCIVDQEKDDYDDVERTTSLTFYNLDWVSSTLDCEVEYHANYPFLIIT